MTLPANQQFQLSTSPTGKAEVKLVSVSDQEKRVLRRRIEAIQEAKDLKAATEFY